MSYFVSMVPCITSAVISARKLEIFCLKNINSPSIDIFLTSSKIMFYNTIILGVYTNIFTPQEYIWLHIDSVSISMQPYILRRRAYHSKNPKVVQHFIVPDIQFTHNFLSPFIFPIHTFPSHFKK